MTGEPEGAEDRTPQARFAAVVDSLANEPGVTVPGTIAQERKFGSSPELRVDGHIFAMLVRDRFVVKLPGPRVDALVASAAGSRFDAGKGRPMREWVVAEGSTAGWLDLAREAMRFVSGRGNR